MINFNNVTVKRLVMCPHCQRYQYLDLKLKAAYSSEKEKFICNEEAPLDGCGKYIFVETHVSVCAYTKDHKA